MTPLRLPRATPFGIAAAFAFCLSASALSAAAQTPPPSGGPPPAGRHMPPGAPGDRTQMREHMRERMAEHRAKMIADWTQLLKLTPAQAQALTAAMTPPKRPDRPRPTPQDRAAMANETTLQRLDRMQARLNEREGHMRAHIAAMRAFYTSLSPDQQKSFDTLSRMTHGGMGRHHVMHGGPGGWGGHRGSWGPGGPGEGGPGGPGGRGMRHGPPPPAGE